MRPTLLAILVAALPAAARAGDDCLWLTPPEQLACRAEQSRNPRLCARITDKISRANCVEDATRRR